MATFSPVSKFGEMPRAKTICFFEVNMAARIIVFEYEDGSLSMARIPTSSAACTKHIFIANYAACCDHVDRQHFKNLTTIGKLAIFYGLRSGLFSVHNSDRTTRKSVVKIDKDAASALLKVLISD